MSVEQMPALNATLNGLATVFLLFGYFFIKRENREAHKKCMIAAFVTSAVFLSCYLWYHYHSPGHTVLRHPTAWMLIVEPWHNCTGSFFLCEVGLQC